MSIEIRMPELSADMEEADLVTWLVKPGDRVEAGELIAEIETEKSTVEFESPATGTLLEIRVPEGTNGVAVGTVLALLEPEQDEAHPEVRAAAAPEAVPEEQEEEREEEEDEAAGTPGSPAPEDLTGETREAPRTARDAGARAPEPRDVAPAQAPGAAPATALARRLARRAGLDLGRVSGSGSGGRVVKADVEAVLADAEGVAAPGPAVPTAQSWRPPVRAIPHSRMRRTIATRLAESKRNIPHFYLRIECEIDRLLEVRARLHSGDSHISVNDFVVRAAALALVEVPDANVSWSEEALLQYERVDVAVAVATEGGLVTPVVREAERKELVAISAEIRDLAARARAGRLRPDEYQGGTFTVSNLGMYGIESVYPILDPPQSCILGVGAASERAVVREGEIRPATIMTCTLSADHRALDGAAGARFLAAFKRRIEDPLEMLL